MSFNFSGGEEDESDLELDRFDTSGLLAQQSRKGGGAAGSSLTELRTSPPVGALPATPGKDPGAFNSDDEDDIGWEDGDWEDAASVDGDVVDEVHQEEGADPLMADPEGHLLINVGKRKPGISNVPDDEVDSSKGPSAQNGRDPKPPQKKKRRVNKVLPMSKQNRRALLDVRRSLMLASVAHATQRSNMCGSTGSTDETQSLLFHVALSIIPEEYHPHEDEAGGVIIPTKQDLQRFLRWFFQLVNRSGRRRRDEAAGGESNSRRRTRSSNGRKVDAALVTPITEDGALQMQSRRNTSASSTERLLQLMTNLPPTSRVGVSEAESLTTREKVLLLLSMTRSLGWRSRYVTSLEPMSLQLTVDHPLLAKSGVKSTSDLKLIQKVIRTMSDNGMLNGGDKRKVDVVNLLDSESDDDGDKKPAAIVESRATKLPEAPSEEESPSSLLSWVEILCSDVDGANQMPYKAKAGTAKSSAKWVPIYPEQESLDAPEEVESILAWREVHDDCGRKRSASKQAKTKGKWFKAPPSLREANLFSRKVPVSYVLAVESSRGENVCARLTDVTPRYAGTWSQTLRLRGASVKELRSGAGKCPDDWWAATLKKLNGRQDIKRRSKTPSVRSVTKVKSKGKVVDVLELDSSDDDVGDTPAARHDEFDSGDDEHDAIEAKELKGEALKEQIPTSKAKFKVSPFYVIPSVLGTCDVLHPDARKRLCGVFKGELVYRRSDVSKAQRAQKWLYQGRKVRQEELTKPAKQVKARKKPAKGFQALESYGISEGAQRDQIAAIDREMAPSSVQGMDNLYGIWQTDPWSPEYVGPNDEIPRNEYRNVELALINPGLAHIDLPRVAPIAKKLGIPYAPCMVGYEVRRRGRAPSIRGIVVHNHNVDLLKEARVEWESHAVEKEREDRRKRVLHRWKRLVVGMMTKERLEREYSKA